MAILFGFCFLWMSPVYTILQWSPRGLFIPKMDIGFVQTFSYAKYKIDQKQVEPPPGELIMIIFNFVACVPVLLAVGGFRYEPKTLF